jgi:hypothetical protein
MNISSAGSSIYSLQNVYKNYRNAGEKEKSAESSEKRQEQQVQREAAKLQQIEREVIAHEQAHMSAGAHLAGSARYQYTKGPDGKNYATGGEVSIKIPEGKDPEETIQLMDQVIRAALAPANPSPQDLAVASRASMKQIQARGELSKSQTQAYQAGSNLGKELDMGKILDISM